jgi:lipoyl(octanoyl) transferase
MPFRLSILDLGVAKYSDALQTQQQLFDTNVAAKEQGTPTTNTLILCEHPPVYTLGKSGKRENILVNDEELNAELFHVLRGGDVTFHGPGQMVAYPILDLDVLGVTVAQYIFNLEEIIVKCIAVYGLHGERIDGAAGIWLGAGTPQVRKICAIGAKVSRHITMHGLAANVNTDLDWFNKILSCGLPNMGVTSLQAELNRDIDMEEFKRLFIDTFNAVFTTQS